MVDGVFSVDVRRVSGVPQDSLLGPLPVLLYVSDLSIILVNNHVGLC